MTIDEMIERLEDAKEGSRELDLLIAKATRQCDQEAWLSRDDDIHWQEWHSFGSSYAAELLSDALPRYTTSLNAALTLVPEGWSRYCFYTRRNNSYWVAVMRPRSQRQDVEERFTASHQSQPIAFCIAVLRAYSSSNTHGA